MQLGGDVEPVRRTEELGRGRPGVGPGHDVDLLSHEGALQDLGPLLSRLDASQSPGEELLAAGVEDDGIAAPDGHAGVGFLGGGAWSRLGLDLGRPVLGLERGCEDG